MKSGCEDYHRVHSKHREASEGWRRVGKRHQEYLCFSPWNRMVSAPLVATAPPAGSGPEQQADLYREDPFHPLLISSKTGIQQLPCFSFQYEDRLPKLTFAIHRPGRRLPCTSQFRIVALQLLRLMNKRLWLKCCPFPPCLDLAVRLL